MRKLRELSKNAKLGVELGGGIYKVRVPNSSIPTGKSGGFRVITYYKSSNTIYLITIYSKTQKDTILTDTLKEIINNEL